MAKFLFVMNWYKDRVDKYAVGSDGLLTYDTSLEIDNASESGWFWCLTGQGNYLYMALDETLYKINAITMEVETQRTFTVLDYFIGCWAIGDYVYLVEHNGIIFRCSTDDLSGNETLDMSDIATGSWLFPMLDNSDSNLLWIGYGKYPPYYDCGLAKVNVTTFTRYAYQQYHTDVETLSYGLPQDINQDDDFVYLINDIGEVVKIEKDDISTVYDWYNDGTDWSYSPFKTSWVNKTAQKLYAVYDNGWLGMRVFDTSDMTVISDLEDEIDALGFDISWDGGWWSFDGIKFYAAAYNYSGNDFIWVTDENGTNYQTIDIPLPSSGPVSMHGLELDVEVCDTHITIAGVENTVCCEAIDWNEEQLWSPAIRDVPRKTEGQKVDFGTKVVQPKILSFVVRLSDEEVEALNALFEEHVTVTITAVSDDGGTWTHLGWFTKKPKTFEYKKEEDAVREWRVVIEVSVSLSEYEG